MIRHESIFNTKMICDHFAEKDGVPIQYVCTSALDAGVSAMDIFYRDTPHPKFGNRYFGIYLDRDNGVMITNADRIESFEFGLVEGDDSNLRYSAHRQDHISFKNGNMIDGGRAYIRSSGGPIHIYVVRDGCLVEQMCEAFLTASEELEDECEQDDGQPDEAQEWADYDPDC